MKNHIHRILQKAGPLAGREGILVRRKGATRVVLSIELIQRSVALAVGLAEAEPV